MAHKKAAGSTALGRDSQPKYLGVKMADGEFAGQGNILVRQRGTAIRAGEHVQRGKDDTLFALTSGIVSYTKKKIKRFDGSLKIATFAHIKPQS